MSQDKAKAGSPEKKFAFRSNALTTLDAGAKLRVGVPDKLKMVHLDVHDGKKAQPFQNNLMAFADYAGSNVSDGATIGMFIVNLIKTPIKKPKDPAASAGLTDKKIWESEFTRYVRKKKSVARRWQKCTTSFEDVVHWR